MANFRKSLIRKIVKNKNKIPSTYSTSSQNAKVAATVRNELFMKVENALNV